MKTETSNKPSLLLVVVAFAVVYIVWGSTYFFIEMGVKGFPPMLMGALRFFTAGIIMLIWCGARGDKIWSRKTIISSGISGVLMLFIGTGVLIWIERYIPSSMVAIMISANPIWFVVLDKANWRSNLSNRSVIGGIIVGFAGVLLLFGEEIMKSLKGNLSTDQLTGIILLLFSPIAWCAGSLYSKKHGSGAPARVNSAWQMVIAGLAFIPGSFIHGEYSSFSFSRVPTSAWLALIYLIIFGSIAAFSAYVWLLSVRPATQVSTHAYVNPVIAVLLGVLFANESVSGLQIIGLIIILFSVMLVNLDKYSFGKQCISCAELLKRKKQKQDATLQSYEISINK
jgi:drug/metabolite transporter (DMT)-like permease